MAALLDEHKQWVDESTGELINNGYIYIGTAGLDAKLNTIKIYSDRGLSTEITNPQRTGADGRTVNKVWVPDRYSIKVEDQNNVQKYNNQQAGELSQVGNTILSNVSGVNDLVASASPAITELSNGQTYILTTSAANTGPMTLKIDTTAVKSIKKDHDQDMASGDLEANQILSVVYNSTDDVFEVISNLVLNFSDVLSLAGTAPYLKWTESDATADNGKWRMMADGERLVVQAGNDVEDTWVDAFDIERTGTVIDEFNVVNGNLVVSSGTLTVSGGITANGNDVQEDGPAVTGYAQGHSVYVEESNSPPAGFNVVTGLVEATWESVGPTGSGADNTWAALDDVPTGAKWVELKVQLVTDANSATSGSASLYARKTGTTRVANNLSIIAYGLIEGASGNLGVGSFVHVRVPIDSSGRFDLYYSDTHISTIFTYLTGFGV